MSPPQSYSDFSSVTDSSNFSQYLTIGANNINATIKDEEEEEDILDSFEIDESFWSEELSSSSASENCSMISDFISSTTDDQPQQLQLPPSDSIEPVFDYDLDSWYSLFIGSGGLPELPEF